jgi:phosphotransferase system HPr (HPr) family protein
MNPTIPSTDSGAGGNNRHALKVPLLHKTGLHMRPAGRIMELAAKYKADIKLSCSDRTANAKSILDMLSLAAPPGAELFFEADGADAKEALDALNDLIRNHINLEEDY